MDVLIDTNIILDSALNRGRFAEPAKKIIDLCISRELNACIAAHTVTNAYYLLSKVMQAKDVREYLLELCRVISIVDVNKSKIMYALENDNFKDFEDCLQDECADYFCASYIITQNLKDFQHSKTKAVTPSEFMEIFSKENI
jgi:predicted nucleic acid-binding protein